MIRRAPIFASARQSWQPACCHPCKWRRPPRVGYRFLRLVATRTTSKLFSYHPKVTTLARNPGPWRTGDRFVCAWSVLLSCSAAQL